MTELDKLKAHLPFDFSDPEVDALNEPPPDAYGAAQAFEYDQARNDRQ